MGEFELIARYFQHRLPRSAIALGSGDDCALLQPADGHVLAVSTDMLVEGRHFLSTVQPAALGHKALAVNLSDLAAIGAEPLAFTLALALPRAEAAWLADFSQGLLALADAHRCALIGGDTTAGPLNICITVFGQLPAQAALRRDAARVGDDIYISGTPGHARLALEVLRGRLELEARAFALARAHLERPTPRLALGQALRGIAHAAIDLSDGLLGDLGHILAASRVGAHIHWPALAELAASSPILPHVPAHWQHTAMLNGGDDYELLFTAPSSARAAVHAAAQRSHTPVQRIGTITAEPGLRVWDANGQPLDPPGRSFDHFTP